MLTYYYFNMGFQNGNRISIIPSRVHIQAIWIHFSQLLFNWKKLVYNVAWCKDLLFYLKGSFFFYCFIQCPLLGWGHCLFCFFHNSYQTSPRFFKTAKYPLKLLKILIKISKTFNNIIIFNSFPKSLEHSRLLRCFRAKEIDPSY